MATIGHGVKMTLDEYLELPPSQDARVDYLLVDGELVEVAKSTFEHNEFVFEIIIVLLPHVRAGRLGRISRNIDVILDPNEATTYAPDLVFLAAGHLDRLRDGRVWGAPDLVVEVLSPSTAADDQGRKFDAYFRHGVPWYWIIDPVALTIAEYRNTDEGYLRTQTVLRGQPFRPGLFPDLTIDLAALSTR